MKAGWKGNEKIHDECFAKLNEGEPFFVLRGQDKLAPALLRAWAALAWEHSEMVEPDKIKEVLKVAKDMENWPDRKFPD